MSDRIRKRCKFNNSFLFLLIYILSLSLSLSFSRTCPCSESGSSMTVAKHRAHILFVITHFDGTSLWFLANAGHHFCKWLQKKEIIYVQQREYWMCRPKNIYVMTTNFLSSNSANTTTSFSWKPMMLLGCIRNG